MQKFRYTITLTADPATGDARESFSGDCADYEITPHSIIIRHAPSHFEIYGLAHVVGFTLHPLTPV